MNSESYLEPYRRHAPTFGTEFGITLWASEASQVRRFEVFAQVADLSGRRVLDAGCSRGDFCAYMIEHGIEYEQYIGIDAMEKVIDFAKTRGFRDATFHAGDMLAQPELFTRGDPHITVISGTLNTMSDEQVFTMLDAAWAGCSHMLVFNFLSDMCSDKAPEQTDYARRLSAQLLLRWAASKTWCFVLRQDYFTQGHDATISMRKV